MNHLTLDDLALVSFKALADACFSIYREGGGRPHPYGARQPDRVRMHWSREWEYPYALLVSGVQSGDQVLDLGCGGSPLPVLLSRYGCSVTALDAADVTVGEPSLRSYGDDPVAKYQLERRRFKLVQHDLLQDPWPSAGEGDGYDTIVCISVLEGVSGLDLRKFFREAHRQLRPGGRLVLTFDVDREGIVNVELEEELAVIIPGFLRAGGDHPAPPLVTLPGTYHVTGDCWVKV